MLRSAQPDQFRERRRRELSLRVPRPLGLLSVDTGPPNKGCGAVALTLHKVSRLGA